MITRDAGTILGHLLRGDGVYKLQHVFVEYENNGGQPVVTPDLDPTQGVEYYTQTLATSSNRDFLRLAISDLRLDTTDPANVQLEITAIVEGVTGVNGKPFGSASQSRLYGYAIVASPTSDVFGDVLYARAYMPDDKQIVRTDDQLKLKWKLNVDYTPSVAEYWQG